MDRPWLMETFPPDPMPFLRRACAPISWKDLECVASIDDYYAKPEQVSLLAAIAADPGENHPWAQVDSANLAMLLYGEWTDGVPSKDMRGQPCDPERAYQEVAYGGAMLGMMTIRDTGCVESLAWSMRIWVSAVSRLGAGYVDDAFGLLTALIAAHDAQDEPESALTVLLGLLLLLAMRDPTDVRLGPLALMIDRQEKVANSAWNSQLRTRFVWYHGVGKRHKKAWLNMFREHLPAETEIVELAVLRELLLDA